MTAGPASREDAVPESHGQAGVVSKLFAYAPTTLIRIVVRFAALFIFTRLLSPSEYGVYTLVLSAVALTQTLVFLWIEAAAFRFVERARRRGWLPDLTATLGRLSIIVLALTAFAAGVVGSLAWGFGQFSLAAAILAGLGLAALGFLTNLRREVLRAQGRAGRYALIDAASKIGGLGLGIGFVVFGGWEGLGPIAGAMAALTLILMVDTLTWRARPSLGKFRPALARLAFRFGSGLAVAQGAAVLLATGDRFVIAAMLGTDAAGTYAAGYGVAAQLVGFMFAGTSLAAAPLTLRTFESRGEAESVEIARRYVQLLLFLTVPAAAGLVLVAEPLAHLVIGERLAASSVVVIQWIAPASVLAGLVTTYAELPFMLKQKTRQFGLLLGGAGVINIALNVMLIPAAGIVGAIVATIVSYSGALIAAIIMGRRHFPLPVPLRQLSLIALNTAVMVGVVMFNRSLMIDEFADTSLVMLAAMVAAGAVAYAACSSLMLLGLRKRSG
ncbi:MAG: polysaccharide biosynthesis C-terminal domain-containing protein [Pseudomonadota bacterium]